MTKTKKAAKDLQVKVTKRPKVRTDIKAGSVKDEAVGVVVK
jgi:hypothetical protein